MMFFDDPTVQLLIAGKKDVASVIGAIATSIGAIFVAIGAAAAQKKKREQTAQARAAGKAGHASSSKGSKERDMVFVPITPNISSTPVSSGNSHIHPIAVFWFVVTLLLAMASMITGVIMAERGAVSVGISLLVGFAVLMAIAFILLFCLKVVDQWDRVVVLRLGKFKIVQQPGMFWLVPFVDTVASWIDTRVQTDDLLAEETLTRDTVPVDVDAVMFWLVYDPKKAALEVEDFQSAVTWAAQTALRDLIGKTELAELLVGRDILDAKLQEIIDERTEPWGITVQSVEIREIKIPRDLQDAMSRQAQAERERQARVILGESEKQIAQSFADAAKKYKNDPTALHLRAMNMLFEGLKEKGSLMIVPSSAIDSMNLGAIGGMASLGMHAGQDGELPPASE